MNLVSHGTFKLPCLFLIFVIDRCHNQLEGQAQEIQTMFETFAEQQRNSAKDAADISVELEDSPLRDEERERLERLREGLDQERQKFTEAAAKFGRDKAALEVCSY